MRFLILMMLSTTVAFGATEREVDEAVRSARAMYQNSDDWGRVVRLDLGDVVIAKESYVMEMLQRKKLDFEFERILDVDFLEGWIVIDKATWRRVMQVGASLKRAPVRPIWTKYCDGVVCGTVE